MREEIFALVLSARTFIALKQFSCLLVLTIICNKQTQHDCFLKVVFFWFKLNFLSVAAGTNFVNIHAIFKCYMLYKPELIIRAGIKEQCIRTVQL